MVLAAVLLGVGAGVVIALRDRSTVASPPVTSAPPSSPLSSAPVSPSVATPTPAPSATPTPSGPPDPFAALPASAPLDAQVIVWPRVREGNWDVALLDLRTDKETRLTKGETIDWGPVISANRRTIMYTRMVDDRADDPGDGRGRHRGPAPVRPAPEGLLPAVPPRGVPQRAAGGHLQHRGRADGRCGCS